MRKTYKFMAALFGMAILMAACTKDETLQPQFTPAAVGDEILFGARAGFESSNPDSRTVYSGKTYTSNGATFERIDWVDKTDGSNTLYDQIEIYCDLAQTRAHYDVYNNKEAEEKNDYAYLSKQEGEAALQWANNEEHTFYAMYPSSKMFANANGAITVVQGVEIDEDGWMHGEIPVSQPGTVVDATATNKVINPDMRYAYMAAKTTTTPQATDSSQGVNLTFVPVVTAVQIQFTLSETATDGSTSQSIDITDLQVEGTGIAGDFKANLAEWSGTGYPECTAEHVTDVITMPLSEKVTINATDTLTFTVFMSPTAKLSNLKVKFTSSGVFQSRTLKAADGENFIKPFCKNRLKNVALPAAGVTYDLSKWMEQLDNNFTMKRLSLPGTGGSFSYNYTGSNADYYAEQHTGSTTAADGTTPAKMDFNAQWNAGIRAFEIVSDRATTGWGELGDETILGNITCNKKSVSITVTEAMNQLIAKVKNSDECAVVVFTYQPEDAILSRSGNKYATCLKKWYNSLGDDKDVFIKYTPDLKLGPKKDELTSGTTTSDKETARGNIMVIVRANQKHEKDQTALIGGHQTTFSDITTALSGCPFVVIDGCGTAKDRWGARGYKIKTGGNEYPMLDQSNSHSDYTTTDGTAYDSSMIIESYMTSNVLGFDTYTDEGGYDTYTSGDYTVMRPMGGDYNLLNFEFETDDANVKVWFQEWQRVCETATTSNPYWFASKEEKLDNAEQTFIKAINDSTGNTIYINSLCGFYISGTPSDSGSLSTGNTYGGSGGNIAGLAAYMNPEFSDFVAKSGFEQTTGPTGIILMDRVVPGMEVVGKIISNNYKFSLAE